MPDVQFSYQVKKVNFLDAAVIGKMVQQSAYIYGTGDHFLNDPTKCLKS